MAVKVLKSSVHKNGKEYLHNDVITGLDKKEEHRLVNKGYCEFIKQEKKLLSVDDFSALKADEQKIILDKLTISPASNEKERIKQYSDLLGAES